MITHFLQDYQIQSLAQVDLADYTVFTVEQDDEISAVVDAIDVLLAYMIQFKRFNASIQGDLERLFGRLKEAIAPAASIDLQLHQLLSLSLEEAQKIIKEYLDSLRLSQECLVRENEEAHILASLRDLQHNGFCEFQVSDNDVFERSAASLLEQARQEFAGRDDWRGLFWQDFEKHEVYKQCKQFVMDNRLLDIVSLYKGYLCEFAWSGWDYNHDRQKWFKRKDIDPGSHATNYYHLDSGFDKMKVMFYLTDVSDNDGPFKYVRGSQLLSHSMMRFALHLGLDRKWSNFLYGDNTEGKVIFLDNPALLKKFPSAFIGSSHFGDYLAKDAPLTTYLLKHTERFTRKKGAVILFDGNRGVHSGGNPIAGERLIAQIGFQHKKQPKSRLKRLFG